MTVEDLFAILEQEIHDGRGRNPVAVSFAFGQRARPVVYFANDFPDVTRPYEEGRFMFVLIGGPNDR